MKGIYREAVSEVDTFDAYLKNVMIRNNNLIIPYLNIGICNHPLHNSKKLKFINYSYLVAEDVQYLAIWVKQGDRGKHYNLINRQKTNDMYYWGGFNLDPDSIFCDLRICCKNAFLQTLEISELSDDIWVPYDTVNQPLNIDKRVLDNFWDGVYMPDNIKELIK